MLVRLTDRTRLERRATVMMMGDVGSLAAARAARAERPRKSWSRTCILDENDDVRLPTGYPWPRTGRAAGDRA